MRITFASICAMAAARGCYDSGMTVAQIAAQAKRSPSTIRRWIKTADPLYGMRRRP